VNRPIKVCHIINDLDIAGAEIMLLRLLQEMDRERFEPCVISLSTLGEVADRIVQLEIPVRALQMRPSNPSLSSMFTLIQWIRARQPDIIQTWMYHSDLVGGIAARFAGKIPVVWGIHNSNLDPKKSKRRTLWIVRLLARLSYIVPAHIVSCSQIASQLHKRLGYAPDMFTVIPNGFDLREFKPNEASRESVYQELNIPLHIPLVGVVARFDPQKDPKNFIRAAGQVHQRFPQAHFLMCGEHMNDENQELMKWIGESGYRSGFHLLGRRNDIPRLMAALDVLVSASAYGEAFPLVVGEAMACGVPCVVTDVGDSAEMVTGSGLVVPPRNYQALAEGICTLLSLGEIEKKKLGADARARVENNYSIQAAAQRYEKLYSELL
jgi:glycosyltransferase involved in cell wall biosynthesis